MGYDFSLSEQQQLLQAEAARVVGSEIPFELARRAEDGGLSEMEPVWRRLAALGWAGLLAPPPAGGSGLGAIDLAIVARELGRRAALVPLVYHNAALRHICARAPSLPATIHVEPFAAGNQTLTIAHYESGDHFDPSRLATVLRSVNGSVQVTGTKYFAPFATLATHFLVTGRLDGGEYATIVVPASEAAVHPYRSTGRDGRARVELDVTLPSSAIVYSGSLDAITQMLDLARLGVAAFACGAAHEAMTMAVSYAQNRVIFGRPQGSFQAIQHRCADMLCDSEAAWMLTLDAAWRLDTGRELNAAVEAACSYAAAGAQRVAAHAHQIHGAMGFTFELDLQLLSTAIKAAASDLGRERDNREAVAVALGL